MMDTDRIDGIFRNLDGFIAQLRQTRSLSRDDILADRLKLAGAKYLLQVSVECCLDAANHIIARQGWRKPESMADAFSILAENGVVSQGFLPTLQQMARFRNRLVHLYWEVDESTVYDILQHSVTDLERFERETLEFLGSTG